MTIDLGKKSFIYPALINTHDHMRGNYLPRVGPPKGVYYMNWLPWDNDLKASETYTERSNISDKELYQLSTYKNLFSGVTTVNDHFPQAWNKEILPHLPIRAILEYGLAHECSSYDLKWGDGIEVEHTRAIKKHWPFITHLSEGFDRESMDGVITLENLKVLDSHCLLIHCIGFSDEDIKKVANAGASISWCGASNIFMFNVTCKIRKFIKAGINVTIGTDSSHTGSFNLFEEMHYDRELYRQMYGEDLPAKKIFEMVTINAAKAFWLDKKLGSLDEGKLGDILLLKAKKDDPYENFASAGMKDIELLTMAGKPLYGEMRFIDIFGGKLPEGYTEITVGGRPMFIAGDPAALYREARKKVGFKKKLDYLPFEPEA
ncbi:amidohydrolase family protein [Breznakiella homolactica]|uniref:amidohydrolase family protein n=1 Tax=Breznakiella homolactica TaxID=2798577 RepID=UPI001CBA61D1|nr:amidohydrolase family protein [Breznakiella homolactica]